MRCYGLRLGAFRRRAVRGAACRAASLGLGLVGRGRRAPAIALRLDHLLSIQNARCSLRSARVRRRVERPTCTGSSGSWPFSRRTFRIPVCSCPPRRSRHPPHRGYTAPVRGVCFRTEGLLRLLPCRKLRACARHELHTSARRDSLRSPRGPPCLRALVASLSL